MWSSTTCRLLGLPQTPFVKFLAEFSLILTSFRMRRACGLKTPPHKKVKELSKLETEITKHVNDTLQKYTCALLRDVMPEFYGIKTGRVKELINPELPEVNVSGGGTDMIFLIEDDSYLHFGFETGKDKDDVVRHLNYDARLIQRDGRMVNTIIVYTADVKTAPPGIKSGTLVYNPHIILMGDYDGNTIYAELNTKMKDGQELSDKDILNLLLLPLMKHTMPRKELAAKSIELAQSITDTEKRNACVATAYAFSHNYLDEAEKQKILEVLIMTDLGAMLVMDVEHKKSIEFAKKLLKRNTPIEIIMEDTNLDQSTILSLQEEINDQPPKGGGMKSG